MFAELANVELDYYGTSAAAQLALALKATKLRVMVRLGRHESLWRKWD